MKDRAEDAHLSLYTSDKLYVNELVKAKRFKNPSDCIQFLIRNFKKNDGKIGLKNFMLFVGYPMIFAVVMLYVAITTQRVNESLLKHLIISELIIYNQIYFIIGFAFLGIIIAGFVFILSKRGKE